MREPQHAQVIQADSAAPTEWRDLSHEPDVRTRGVPAPPQVFDLDDRRLILSHLDRLLWPEEGITKGDLIDYYLEVSTLLMPFLVNRPLSFLRCPEGVAGECAYQKTAPPGLPAWVPTRRIRSEHAVGAAEYVVGSEPAALVYMINAGALSPHAWNCTVEAPDRPDQLLLDLDPTSIAFREVRNAALLVRDLLAHFKIQSWVKTSGGRGLHIMVPLAAVHTFDQVREAAEIITRRARACEPRLFTTDMRRARRRGKILIDIHRNRRGATLVSPFAVREFPGAPIATPLDWPELTRPIYPEDFDFKNIRERLRAGSNPLRDFFTCGQSITPLLESARSRHARPSA